MFHTHRLMCFLLVSSVLLAQDDLPTIEVDPITVTANRSETPLDEVGSSISVITELDLQRSGHHFVLDALRDVAGVDLVRNGGAGTTTSLFMRGAESGHTLVIIDGIEMNDPISSNNSYNLAHLSVDNIERIEVVRGPQSPLYGSDALGGVIHIITKQGDGEFHAGLHLEAGSYDTRREALQIRGGEQVSYSISASNFEYDGFSAASEALGNQEKDGYKNTSIAASLTVKPNDSWGLKLNARHTRADGDIDSSGGAFGDDPNFVFDDEQLFVRASGNVTLMDGRWQQELGLAFSDQERGNHDPEDPDHMGITSLASYNGEKVKIDWQHNLELGGGHSLVFGAETEEEKGNSLYESNGPFGPYRDEFTEQKASTTGFYLQDHFKVGEALALTLGGRFDDHDRFGSEVTWRGTFAYKATESSILKGSLGTAFKAPTLFQLYSPFGSEDLQAEESLGWDVGFEQRFLGNTLSLGLTWFENDFDQLIEFDSATFLYNNIAEAETSGAEFHLRWLYDAHFSINANYTLLGTEDKTTGERLLRRARNKWHVRFNYGFGERGHVQLAVRGSGKRDDVDFSTYPSQRLELDNYTVVNLAGNLALGSHLALNARVDNVLDEDYTEIVGYGTPGASAYLGIRLDY